MKLVELSNRSLQWGNDTKISSSKLVSFYQTEAFKSFHYANSEGKRFYSIKGVQLKDPVAHFGQENRPEYFIEKQKYQESMKRLQRHKQRRKRIYDILIPSPALKGNSKQEPVSKNIEELTGRTVAGYEKLENRKLFPDYHLHGMHCQRFQCMPSIILKQKSRVASISLGL